MSEKLEYEIVVKNNELSKELKKSSQDAVGAESSLKSIASQADKTKDAIARAAKESSGFKDILSTTAGVFLGTGLIQALSTIKNALGAAATEAIDFKRELLAIETILPRNTKLTAELVDELRNLGVRFGTSSSTQAKTYYDIISAGVEDAADATKLLVQANELATGGIADTAQTINLLTTIYNVYGKELATTSEAADSLFKTVQIGKTNIAELSSELGQALPIAKSFGIGLDEVGSVLAQLTNAGISTSESVTILNAVLSAIAKNGEKLGPGFNSLAVQTDGLGVVLERLKERTNGSNDALFELLGRQEAVRGVQSLTAKGLENYNKVLAEYATKAGVAADASDKIIEQDLGKQFDIFSAGVKNAASSLIGLFVPAVNSALKATNNLFFGVSKFDDSSAEKGLVKLRSEADRLKVQFDSGRISQDAYKRSIELINKEISFLSTNISTAKNPLVTLSAGLSAEATKIKTEIFNIKNGFDVLAQIQGPDAANAKLIQLESRLKDVNAKIQEINKAPPIAPVVATPRSEDLINTERELQAQITAIKQQAALEQNTIDQQRAIIEIDNLESRRQSELQSLLDFELAKNQIILEQELAKNELIKDPQNRRLANEKAIEALRLANTKAINSKLLAEDKLLAENQAKINKDREANQRDTFSTIATLASSNNKTLAGIGKAAALTQIAIDGPQAVTKALAAFPPPFNFAAATAVGAAVAAQAAKVVGVQFANSGFVGSNGATMGADNTMAQVRTGEMVLNADDQKTLFDAIKSGSLGGGGDIVIKIDEREIARAVRNQKQAGFAI